MPTEAEIRAALTKTLLEILAEKAATTGDRLTAAQLLVAYLQVGG